LLCTLRTHQSPGEWQHSLPACSLALAGRDFHPLDFFKWFPPPSLLVPPPPRFSQRDRPGRYIQQNAGVVFVPTEHEGNTYESEEEAEIITQIVGELTGQFFIEADKPERLLTLDDILVVTPYNLQVRKLTERLPGIRVGTVDKFQGQEAIVVIYSMCASSGDASPRGIEFLFSKNRLNVAISRAQTLAIVVGNRSLAHTRCTTLGQMQLVNVFCRAVEHSAVGSGTSRPFLRQ